eukprot:scaffold85179_cov33-Tisochrysis_lutea.AAC.1
MHLASWCCARPTQKARFLLGRVDVEGGRRRRKAGRRAYGRRRSLRQRGPGNCARLTKRRIVCEHASSAEIVDLAARCGTAQRHNAGAVKRGGGEEMDYSRRHIEAREQAQW